MNVAFETKSVTVQNVWFDPRSGHLHAVISGIDYSLPLAQIPDADFESGAPVVGFATGCGGSVIVCRHQDGAETWLPADMWLPGGFTASA
jgi:hypothetical protein